MNPQHPAVPPSLPPDADAIHSTPGGIGIMNIMLATVTERTREIGIRRALGAKRRDITLQFLVETIVLSGAGGLLGIGLGIALSFLVTRLLSLETILQTWSPLLAFAISVVVGVIFGSYPAHRAALMDPIEALRHEEGTSEPKKSLGAPVLAMFEARWQGLCGVAYLCRCRDCAA